MFSKTVYNSTPRECIQLVFTPQSDPDLPSMRADNFRTNINAYNMASNSFLTEEDVPGAECVQPSIVEHTRSG